MGKYTIVEASKELGVERNRIYRWLNKHKEYQIIEDNKLHISDVGIQQFRTDKKCDTRNKNEQTDEQIINLLIEQIRIKDEQIKQYYNHVNIFQNLLTETKELDEKKETMLRRFLKLFQ